MDPILVKALREYRAVMAELSKAGTTPTAQQQEEFFRVKTEGKFGLTDAQKALSSIDATAGDRAKSLGRSAVQGLTLGFGDEILGALPKFLGGGDDAKEEMRMKNDAFADKYPGYALGSEVLGGFGLGGLGPELDAGSTGMAMLKGAAAGGAAGAASGAGNAEGSLEDRAKAAAVPGGLAALLGALVPAAGAAWKMRSPEARAAARLEHAIGKSGGVDKLRSTLQEFDAAGRGKETMLADLSDPLRREADFAANTSDDVLVPLAKTVRDRQADASSRVVEDVRRGVGTDAHAPTRQDELAGARSDWAAGPEGYGGIRDANPQFDAAPIAARLNQPKIKDAWKMARLAGNITDGDPLDELMQTLSGAKTKKAPRPVSFDDLQQFKRTLDDKVKKAFRDGNGALGKAFATVRDEVEGVMETSVPNVKAVNAGYRDRMNLEKALASGEEAWDMHDSRGLAKQVTALSAPELEQFRYGLASKMIAKLRSAATNRSEAKSIMDASAAMQDKLKVVFGDEKTFNEFVKRVSTEAELGKMRSAVSGSETARRLASQGFDPAELGIDAAGGALRGSHGVVEALMGAGKRAARAAVTRGTARELGPKLLTQGTPDIEELLRQWGLRGSPQKSVMMKAGIPAASLFQHFNR